MLDEEQLIPLIKSALAEDIGQGDITSEFTIPKNARAEIAFVAREDLVVCGVFIPRLVYQQLGANVHTEEHVEEGAFVKSGQIIATAKGPARTVLTGERVVLNLMERMSGVATLTKKYIDAVKGTKAAILDTRKTMPGLRVIDKYSVRIGGGKNHRMRLDDMVLIKDNHIEIGIRDLGFGIGDMIKKARKKLSSRNPNSETPIPIVIECDTLIQVEEALKAKPDRLLLDNMSLENLRKAVKLGSGKVLLEASGGVSLETVRAIAETGVDYISVGRLTHSAPAADIGADIKIKNPS